MLQCMGYDTGMDLGGLIAAAAELELLVQHELSSQVSRAGHRLTRHAPPADFNDIVTRAKERGQKELHL
jgi:hydroxymethylglutaryl-CoA lyase